MIHEIPLSIVCMPLFPPRREIDLRFEQVAGGQHPAGGFGGVIDVVGPILSIVAEFPEGGRGDLWRLVGGNMSGWGDEAGG